MAWKLACDFERSRSMHLQCGGEVVLISMGDCAGGALLIGAAELQTSDSAASAVRGSRNIGRDVGGGSSLRRRSIRRRLGSGASMVREGAQIALVCLYGSAMGLCLVSPWMICHFASAYPLEQFSQLINRPSNKGRRYNHRSPHLIIPDLREMYCIGKLYTVQLNTRFTHSVGSGGVAEIRSALVLLAFLSSFSEFPHGPGCRLRVTQ
jgi:hypothetical protein